MKIFYNLGTSPCTGQLIWQHLDHHMKHFKVKFEHFANAHTAVTTANADAHTSCTAIALSVHLYKPAKTESHRAAFSGAAVICPKLSFGKTPFLRSDKPRMLLFPLINAEMPTIVVGISTFMSRKNVMLS